MGQVLRKSVDVWYNNDRLHKELEEAYAKLDRQQFQIDHIVAHADHLSMKAEEVLQQIEGLDNENLLIR